MTTPEAGLQAQVRNIEATYGKSMAEWTELVRTRALSKHSEIIAMLKTEHAMTHGNANRVALVVRDALAAQPTGGSAAGDPLAALYAGKKAALQPIHETLMARISALGSDIEPSPKRGYISIRRRRQFAMIQPAAAHVDLGLVLKNTPPARRLEAAGSFNAMFTHRVRLDSPEAVDSEVGGWLQAAYDSAG